MHLLQNNDKLNVIPADKTGAPVLIDRKDYTQGACQEHLSNETSYKQIIEQEARMILARMRYKLKEWLKKYGENIPNKEKSFLTISFIPLQGWVLLHHQDFFEFLSTQVAITARRERPSSSRLFAGASTQRRKYLLIR